MTVVLVNPDPFQSATVRIESGGIPRRRVQQWTIRPSDQLTYEDKDCISLLDQDRDEVPDAQQFDTTTPENVTCILSSSQFVLQIRSDTPIQAYASTRSSSDDNDNLRDLSLLLPIEALGSTYRLLDFVSEGSSGAGIDEEDAEQQEDDDDDGTREGGGHSQGKNRTRYTTFGVVALDTGDADRGINNAVGDPATTTTVSLRNDVTGKQSPTYELRSGEVLWYRSRTIVKTPALSSTTARQGPTDADGYDRIGLRPQANVDDADMDDPTALTGEGNSSNSSTANAGLYDITGWHVVASRPVAVFVGSYGELEMDLIDSDSGQRPVVRFQSFQQLVPESALGSTYMVCPIEAAVQPGNLTCDSDQDERFASACQDPMNRVRYIATRNDTTVTLVFPGAYNDDPPDGPLASTTKRVYLEVAGQYYDLETTQPHHAMSNHPLYVYQSLVDNAPEDTRSSLRSSSMMLVPSMDQLLHPQGSFAAGAGASSSTPIRVAVQHDSSSLRLLHARSNRIALNDEFVAEAGGGGIIDDRIDDDVVYQAIRQQRQKRQCRAVGTWMGVEYCCTQLDHVSAGMYTITTAPSSSQAAVAVEVQHPIGVSVISLADDRSATKEVSKLSTDTFLAQFFMQDPTEAPDRPTGGRTTDPTRTVGGASPALSNATSGTSSTGTSSTGTSSTGSTGGSTSTSGSSGGSNASSITETPSRRLYGYSGGMVVQDVMARCSTGGPYAKRVFRFPSPNYALAGEATCVDNTRPARVTWSSSSSTNGNVEFASPTRTNTKVRFQHPGLFTLCMSVTCDGNVQDAASAASCCGTFEVFQEACDAGSPRRLELPESDLPASIKLGGAVDTCADGTAPAVTWFLNATDDDPKKNDVIFVKPDQLETRVSVSSFGKYEVCLRAKCGKIDLLRHKCCTRIRVRVLSVEAVGPRVEPQTPVAAPSEVIQPSPTSSVAGRPSTQTVPAPSRDNEGQRPTPEAVGNSASSPTGGNAGRTERGRSTSPTDSPVVPSHLGLPTGPRSEPPSPIDLPGPSHLGLAAEPRSEPPPSPSRPAPSRDESRPDGRPKRDDGGGSTRDKQDGQDRGRYDSRGEEGSDGGGDRGEGGGGNHRGGSGSGGGDRDMDRDPILPQRTPLNIFFRGG